MNNEEHALDALEKEQEVIPDGYVKTTDGRIVPREKALYSMRNATLNATGEKVLVGHGGGVYRRDEKSGQMTRVDKTKLSKADRKALKRAKKKGERILDADGYDVRLLVMARSKGWTIPTKNTFPAESWNRYWAAAEACEKDPSLGRPIPPHLSGRPENIMADR